MRALTDLRSFGSDEPMTPARGAAALRTAFSGLFLGQTAAALLVGAAVALWTDASGGAGGVLAVVLVGLGVLQGPAGVGAALAPLPEPEQARGAALQRVLLAAVLLSTPAWYLAFLIATGGAAWAAFTLLALLATYGWLGMLLAMRLGARAVGE